MTKFSTLFTAILGDFNPKNLKLGVLGKKMSVGTRLESLPSCLGFQQFISDLHILFSSVSHHLSARLSS